MYCRHYVPQELCTIYVPDMKYIRRRRNRPASLVEAVSSFMSSSLEASSSADLVGQRETLSIQVSSLGILDRLIQGGHLHSLPARDGLHDGQELAGAAGRGHVGGDIRVPFRTLLEHAFNSVLASHVMHVLCVL